MNTTDKYIYELQEIDPISFKEAGVIELSLEVTNKEIDSFELANYELNELGQLKSCQRKEFGWTAFPPLNGSVKVNNSGKVKNLGFTERFKYQNGILESSELIANESQKTKSKVEFKFKNSVLSEIKKSYFQGKDVLLDTQVFKSNSNCQTVKIKRTCNVDKHTKIEIETDFEMNKEGLVTRKHINHLTTIGDSIISYISSEKFKYNSNRQLESSLKLTEFDDQAMITNTEFEYHTSECKMISLIRTQEEGANPTFREYLYDEEKRLKCIKIENSGNETKTNYKRKKAYS